MIIDLHCHLDHPNFDGRISEVISNAKKAGLKVILTAGVNPETNRKNLEYSEKNDIVKCAMGIYPIQTLQSEIDHGEYPLKPNIFDVDEEIEFIKKNKNKIMAIGECGLDYSRFQDKDQQKEVFQKLINAAEELKKPIIVHSRKAELDCIETLESSNLKNIIMHCFSGKKSLVKRINDNGWFFTVPTNVVRSQQFQFISEFVPITQLFCETDAPYLTPFKDKKNEPAFVVESYKKIAEIKKMEYEEVIKNIWMNWQKVFE